jgi:hypothetical protein
MLSAPLRYLGKVRVEQRAEGYTSRLLAVDLQRCFRCNVIAVPEQINQNPREIGRARFRLFEAEPSPNGRNMRS